MTVRDHIDPKHSLTNADSLTSLLNPCVIERIMSLSVPDGSNECVIFMRDEGADWKWPSAGSQKCTPVNCSIYFLIELLSCRLLVLALPTPCGNPNSPDRTLLSLSFSGLFFSPSRLRDHSASLDQPSPSVVSDRETLRLKPAADDRRKFLSLSLRVSALSLSFPSFHRT